MALQFSEKDFSYSPKIYVIQFWGLGENKYFFFLFLSSQRLRSEAAL